MKQVGAVLMAAAALFSGGCLQKDARHTLYISPDDRAVWVAVETDVRSDAADAVERDVEEREYVAAAAEGRHPIAKALAALAPEAVVRTQLLRDERPFGVQVDARVGPVDRVLQRLFDASGVRASVRLTRDGATATLAVLFDFGIEVPEREHPAAVLLEQFESYKLVLTDGAFVAADGWDFSGDVALLSKEWRRALDEAAAAGGRLQLTLSWGPV